MARLGLAGHPCQVGTHQRVDRCALLQGKDPRAAAEIGPAQVRVIAETMNAIPSSVDVTQREAAETELARHARSFDPTSLRKIARHVLVTDHTATDHTLSVWSSQRLPELAKQRLVGQVSHRSRSYRSYRGCHCRGGYGGRQGPIAAPRASRCAARPRRRGRAGERWRSAAPSPQYVDWMTAKPAAA